MSGLPSRFPRTSLINTVAFIEARIQRLRDETADQVEESERRGDGTRTRLFAKRHNQLDAALGHLNDAKLALWDLP